MNWSRTILDGIAMSALFNAVVLVGFALWPQEYSVMFPKEIKEAAAPYVNKTAVRKMKLFLYGLYLFLFFYWAVSAYLTGTKGFWPLFWSGYVEMTFVSVSDFLKVNPFLKPSHIEITPTPKIMRKLSTMSVHPIFLAP